MSWKVGIVCREGRLYFFNDEFPEGRGDVCHRASPELRGINACSMSKRMNGEEEFEHFIFWMTTTKIIQILNELNLFRSLWVVHCSVN